MQGEWSNYTTNPIDAKIWLQFTRIEEYLIDFVFDMISAFKGRFWSILAMNHDESCLNLIAIKSRTQGNCDELKICLQNCLIALRLIKSYLKEENTSFFKESFREKCGPSVSRWDRSRPIVQNQWNRGPWCGPHSLLISPIQSWLESLDASTCRPTIFDSEMKC